MQNLFSHCWFLGLPPLPCWGMGSGGGGRRPHRLELSLYLQWVNFDSLEIRGQVFVLEASEVASGVGEGQARLGDSQLTLHCPTQRGGAVPSGWQGPRAGHSSGGAVRAPWHLNVQGTSIQSFPPPPTHTRNFSGPFFLEWKRAFHLRFLSLPLTTIFLTGAKTTHICAYSSVFQQQVIHRGAYLANFSS